MDARQQDAMQVLRFADRPLSAGVVAFTAGMRLVDAQDALGYLVRHGSARRHHCDDGLMRYSAVASKRDARKPGEPRRLGKSPKADAVLAAIDAGHVRARDIAKATGLSTTYTSVVLYRLRSQGHVYATGHPRRHEWHRTPTDNALPPNLANAVRHPWHGEDGELPPCVGERMRDTTHDIHRRALCGNED